MSRRQRAEIYGNTVSIIECNLICKRTGTACRFQFVHFQVSNPSDIEIDIQRMFMLTRSSSMEGHTWPCFYGKVRRRRSVGLLRIFFPPSCSSRTWNGLPRGKKTLILQFCGPLGLLTQLSSCKSVVRYDFDHCHLRLSGCKLPKLTFAWQIIVTYRERCKEMSTTW